MNTKKFGAAALATVAIAATVAGCGKSSTDEKPVSFSPVVGDNFTGNVSAPQTGGVPVPPSGVTMIGDAVAAQAVANNGLQQGTITSTSNNTTVYYPAGPSVPGLAIPAAQRQAPPAPMQRPGNQRPWGYTDDVVSVYRQICTTGTWRTYHAPVEIQAQSCWTVYGRQLGVRPWYPGDRDRPWEHANYPRPWWDRGWHPDTPVMWVYPPDWHRPKPQPIINVSITININGNPQAKPDPRDRVPYYPIWGVTPGAAVEVKGQAYVAPPLLPYFTVSASAGVYTPPVFPGVVLPPMNPHARDGGSTALPGQQVVGNVNTNANITTPIFVTGLGSGAKLGTSANPTAVEMAGGANASGVAGLPGVNAGSGLSASATAGRGGVGGGAGASGGAKAPGAGAEAGAGASAGAGHGGVGGGAGGAGEATVPGGSAGGGAGGGATATQPTRERPTAPQAPETTQAPKTTQAPETTQAPVTTTTKASGGAVGGGAEANGGAQAGSGGAGGHVSGSGGGKVCLPTQPNCHQ
ncbi:hypothetical protein P0W64_10675 [Tsukamurella sp. 8F]|uniref:hypothetical protein n=1 Tax=unclassified Tsukamurella TaxID=2633480 RepID=UPI0023B97E68|nr:MULTISPECIES: hypothetical protein [unclassified Tsukamurella]MDF0529992.1 hypothetical protein [Tsukamurella sp. 8J]MDF0587236.1 hypothetical protein [Tsukamurella sp. 8F]